MDRGFDGFLGTRASLMLDVVFLAMFALLPVLAWSIWRVRYRQQYIWHKRMQIALTVVLGTTVLLFELDMRRHGWRERALESPYYASMADPGALAEFVFLRVLRYEQLPGWIDVSLAVHLVFATTTALLWGVVVVRGLLSFPAVPQPGAHSTSHRRWGWAAAIDLALTSLTGWVFYYLAFVA